jgi:hypothetical protein
MVVAVIVWKLAGFSWKWLADADVKRVAGQEEALR